MGKIWQVILIVSGVSMLYLLMLVIMPVVSSLASTANTTAAASVNVSLQPGSTSFLLSIPWICWWIPGTIGGIAVVAVLKQP